MYQWRRFKRGKRGGKRSGRKDTKKKGKEWWKEGSMGGGFSIHIHEKITVFDGK